MPRFDAEKLDDAILTGMLRWPASSTTSGVIRNRLAMRKGDPFYGSGLLSRHVLTACKRLERRGLLEDDHPRYRGMAGFSILWKLTEKGINQAAI